MSCSRILTYVLPSQPAVHSDHLPGPSLEKKVWVYPAALGGVGSRHLHRELLLIAPVAIGQGACHCPQRPGWAARQVTHPGVFLLPSPNAAFCRLLIFYLEAWFLSVFIPARVSRTPVTSDGRKADIMFILPLLRLGFQILGMPLTHSESSSCCAPWHRDGLSV